MKHEDSGKLCSGFRFLLNALSVAVKSNDARNFTDIINCYYSAFNAIEDVNSVWMLQKISVSQFKIVPVNIIYLFS